MTNRFGETLTVLCMLSLICVQYEKNNVKCHFRPYGFFETLYSGGFGMVKETLVWEEQLEQFTDRRRNKQ